MDKEKLTLAVALFFSLAINAIFIFSTLQSGSGTLGVITGGVQFNEQPDNDPTVTISLSPTNPSSTDTFTLTAAATDDKAVKEVQIYVNNRLVKTCNASGTTFACEYSNIFEKGSYTYRAYAIDQSNNLGRDPDKGNKQFSVS